MNEILDSFDKNKVKCSGCGKYMDEEETFDTRYPDKIRYWCKKSFSKCAQLYLEEHGWHEYFRNPKK